MAKTKKIKKRPIIRIWDLGDEGYQVDVDTLKITKNQASSIMSNLARRYKKREGIDKE